MKNVIIIGAGPAGLTAGYELLKQSKEYNITILEETPYIGGISRTVRYKGNRMDIGGHRFFSKDKEVTDWWQRIMPPQGAPPYDDKILCRNVAITAGGPDPEKEDRVMLSRNRVSRIYYHKNFFDYPVKFNWNTIKNMGLITTLQAVLSYIRSVFSKLPEDSLESFYINRFGYKLYSMFFESYTEKLWGIHPRDISADWGAQRVKGLSISIILKDVLSKLIPLKNPKGQVETSLIEEFSYPKYGPGQLWERVAEIFEELRCGLGDCCGCESNDCVGCCGGVGCIKYNCKVIEVHTNGHLATGITYVMDGKEITEKADIIISSMPLKNLIQGMSNVPNQVKKIANGLLYRDFVTVGLLVKKLTLKNETKLKTLNNIVPDCWIYVQDEGVKLGRIQIFNNWSPYMVAEPEETIWLGLEYFCSEGDEYWNMDEKAWAEFGINELLYMGVLAKKEDVLDYHEEKVKKAYPAYFNTYCDIDKVIEYLNQFSNLYCVGRNGQHRYNNMDHSMATSFEAVRNILSGRTDKANVWEVNTEKEYHEEKKA